MEQAEQTDCERMLALGLYLAHDLLGATLPATVWRRVQADRVVQSVAAQVRARLFAKTDGLLEDFERFTFYHKLRDGLRGRVQYYTLYLCRYLGFMMIPSPADKQFLSLPTFLFPLYYLLRPLRLIGKYSLRPWKLKDFLPYRIDID
jgi:hypothetical protein